DPQSTGETRRRVWSDHADVPGTNYRGPANAIGCIHKIVTSWRTNTATGNHNHAGRTPGSVANAEREVICYETDRVLRTTSTIEGQLHQCPVRLEVVVADQGSQAHRAAVSRVN